MIIIPGILISAVTFPGVAVHEMAHKLACDITGVEVYEVKYFQLENPSGYVIHKKTESPFKAFLIAYFPFFVNTILGMLISAPGLFLMLGAGRLMEKPIWVEVISTVTLWLGFSIIVNSFPSMQDAVSVWKGVQANSNVSWIIRILTAPISAVGVLGATLTRVCLHVVYAGFMTTIIPMIITNIMFTP